MASATSRVPGFHRLEPKARAAHVADATGLDDDERALLAAAFAGSAAHPGVRFDQMVENVIGSIGVALGIATNFQVDGLDRFVPMAIEEPSVVAAASNAAKMARAAGGFVTRVDEALMIAQVHLAGIEDVEAAAEEVTRRTADVLAAAEVEDSAIKRLGGGMRGLATRVLRHAAGDVLVVHLLVDCRDAMGANAVNTRAERAAPLLESITGGHARLRILSNLADRRLVSARATFRAEGLGGAEVVQGIVEAQRLAELDPYRAATHNKGVMNGVDAVVVATGNDWRAVEAGAHAFAARSGQYGPLTTYDVDEAGDLVGRVSLPVAVGTVGGATKANPMARLALRIMQVEDADTLARVIAAVGLAQNLAALRALATEGIQEGHMRLHRRLRDRA